MSKKRLALLALVVLATSGLVSSAAVRPQAAKAATSCSVYGTVVWFNYNPSAAPVIGGGACWSLEYPIENKICGGGTCTPGSYFTNCNTAKANLTGGGPGWTYDDVNVNGHPAGTDAYIDGHDCNNHGAWEYETMAAHGGFHYAWYPTYVFEENYYGTGWVGYTTSTSAEPGIASTPSSYNPVPLLQADDSWQNNFPSGQTLSSEIANLCYKASFPGGHLFGLYSDDTVSADRRDNIKYELNRCFH